MTEGWRVTDNELLFSMIIIKRGSGKARLQLSTLDTGSQELVALKWFKWDLEKSRRDEVLLSVHSNAHSN